MEKWILLQREPLSLLKPFHIETMARYKNSPPLNVTWMPVGEFDSRSEAVKGLIDYVKELKPELLKWDEDVRKTAGLSLRFRVMLRDNFTCQLCGRSQVDGVKLEVDHKKPKSRGGSSKKSNLWTLCFDCNRGKAAQEVF